MFYIHFNVDENIGGWMGVCRGRGLLKVHSHLVLGTLVLSPLSPY